MGRGNVVLDVVREGTEMGGWRPAWSWDSARDTLRLMKHNLWCNPDACSPFHFSEIRLAGVILFGTWPHGRGKLNQLFVVLIVAIVIVIVFALVVAIVLLEEAIVVVIKWWRKNSLVFGSAFYLPGTILNVLYILNHLISQLSFEVNTIFTCILWLKKLG